MSACALSGRGQSGGECEAAGGHQASVRAAEGDGEEASGGEGATAGPSHEMK